MFTDHISTEEFLQLKLGKNDNQLTNEVSMEIDASNEENNSNNDATITENIDQRGEHGTNHAENVVDVQIDARNSTDVSTYGSEHDEEVENPPNIHTEDGDATGHDIKTIKMLPNMRTQASDAFDISTVDKDQKQPVLLNHSILDNSKNVENASTTNAVSTTQQDRPNPSQPETEHLESFWEQKQPETAVMKEEVEVSHQREPGVEGLKGMQDCQKQHEMKVASDISTGDKDQKELVQLNQVTSDNSQHVENVSTTLAINTEVENDSHVNQPEKEQTDLTPRYQQ